MQNPVEQPLNSAKPKRVGVGGRYCVVGAGFSGAVIARRLAEKVARVLVIDERPHEGGNCHTSRDTETGVMTHWYGPHIFHTASDWVWAFMCEHAEMVPYQHKVKAIVDGRVFSLPINLLTINQFFGKALGPAAAREFLASEARADISTPISFEDQALAFVGPRIYEAFFKGYTKKQWGIDPCNLPASILQRLPIRFDYNDAYFSHDYQAIPKEGYTAVVRKILSSDNIEVRTRCRYEDLEETFAHVFYTGPLDRFFQFRLGPLPYRTLDFEVTRTEGDYQSAAVINYCDEVVPFTRVTEHKHFAPWEAKALPMTICFKEFSRAATPVDAPYYPVRLISQDRLLSDYVALARQTPGVSFLGRLGTYRYLDMDVAIKEALEAADRVDQCREANLEIPTFVCNPLNGRIPARSIAHEIC